MRDVSVDVFLFKNTFNMLKEPIVLLSHYPMSQQEYQLSGTTEIERATGNR